LKKSEKQGRRKGAAKGGEQPGFRYLTKEKKGYGTSLGKVKGEFKPKINTVEAPWGKG